MGKHAWLAGLALATISTSCGGEAVPPTTLSLAPIAVAAKPPEIAPIYGGWVEQDASIIGDLPQGTLLLRGGKRWLAQGKTLTTQRGPGKLDLAVLVPTSEGPILVGSDFGTVDRFDDPLGDPRPIHTSWAIQQLGPTPGRVFVGSEYDDVFVDLATGKVVDPGSTFPLPPGSVAFVDAQRGVAFFRPLASFFETRDGGATWSPLDGNSVADGRVGLGRTNLRHALRGDLTDIDPFPRRSGSAKSGLVAWLEDTPIDPLWEATTGGVATAPGEAIVTGSQRIARVDLRNGDVLEVARVPEPGCRLAATETGPIAICGARKAQSRAYHVRLDPLRIEGAVAAGWSMALLAAPSGAVATLGSCDGDKSKRGTICVRQRDGSWASIEALRPRVDGSALAVFTPTATETHHRIESVDRAGKRVLLATFPERFDFQEVSEAEDGSVWVLAKERPIEVPGTKAQRHVTQVGKIDGGAIRWTALPPARMYALRGSMSIGVHLSERKLSVRTHPDRPAVDIPMEPSDRDVEIHALGFTYGYRSHLGFAPRPDAPSADGRDSEVPPRLSLACKEEGKPRPFADRGMALQRGEEGAKPDAMVGVSTEEGGIVRWRQKGAGLEVRFLDGFAPGSPVREARFTAPKSSPRPNERADHAVVRNGRVALDLGDRDARILRSGAPPSEMEVPPETSISRVWLGDDGSLVASTFSHDQGPAKLHWAPKSTTPTRAPVGLVTEVANVDARGYDVIEARSAFAARARVAAGGPAVGLGDFRRDAGFARVMSVRVAPCEKGASGERTVTSAPSVELDIHGDSGTHAEIEVLAGGGKVCIARAWSQVGRSLARVDFVAAKADIISMYGARWTVRDATCGVKR